jgi:uncharacterized protein (TIGR02001 family)
MTMRITSRVLLAIAFLPVAASPQSGWPLSVNANVAITTDYVFRGVSETKENPAIQGGFDASYPLGPLDLFAGTWASNVDFDDGDEAQTEFDLYAGFSGELPMGWGLAWEAGTIYYAFPGAASSLNYDFLDGYIGLAYAFLGTVLTPEVAAKVYYSPDYSAATGQAVYAESSADFSLPYDTTLGLYVGYQTIEDNASIGLPDYLNWRVTLSKEILGLDFAISYVDTDISNNECFGGTSLCDPRPVFSVSKEF